MKLLLLNTIHTVLSLAKAYGFLFLITGINAGAIQYKYRNTLTRKYSDEFPLALASVTKNKQYRL